MQIGKFTVVFKALQVPGRGYFGTAELTWAEAGRIFETTQRSMVGYPTEAEAIKDVRTLVENRLQHEAQSMLVNAMAIDAERRGPIQ